MASKLIDRSTKFAEKRDCDIVTLQVNTENPAAKNLYEKKDFETEKEKMIKKL